MCSQGIDLMDNERKAFSKYSKQNNNVILNLKHLLLYFTDNIISD